MRSCVFSPTGLNILAQGKAKRRPIGINLRIDIGKKRKFLQNWCSQKHFNSGRRNFRMDILTKAANALKSVFLMDAETVNAEAKAVKRRRKFTPATLAQTFILAFLKKPNASFENVASTGARHLSAPSLFFRRPKQPYQHAHQKTREEQSKGYRLSKRWKHQWQLELKASDQNEACNPLKKSWAEDRKNQSCRNFGHRGPQDRKKRKPNEKR